MALVGLESRFGHVRISHTNLMKTLTKIELGKTGGTSELVMEFVNGRHRKAVLHCNSIESTVVDTEAPCTAFLFDKENMGGERGFD